MQTSKRNVAIFVTALALLMVSSSFIVFASSTATTVNASAGSAIVNQADGYGDVLQYEWRQPGATSSWNYFSEGPAPDAPNILWKRSIPGLSRGSQPGNLQAFNGKVFVRVGSETWALDAFTGNTIWKVPVRGTVFKLDDTRMLISNTCVEIETGNVLWTSVRASFYSREEKMLYTGDTAWDCSDLSQPPTRAWNITGMYEKESLVFYGDGLVFTKGFASIHALNATTGELVWETLKTDHSTHGAAYYNGMLFHGQFDNDMVCWNATTGELLWRFEPDASWAFWGNHFSGAYGKIYGLNQDSYLYCLDAKTGKLVWKYDGPGVYYTGAPIVADGKVYAQTGDSIFKDPQTHANGTDEYVCLDAETGELIWKLPIGITAPNNPHCIAYGNLYLEPATISLRFSNGVWTRPAVGDEIWCIGGRPNDWPMFRGDAAHTAHGSGPTNLALKWKFTTGGPVASSPAIVDGVVYVGSYDKNVYALDADTGSKIWSFATGYQVKSSPAVVGGKVYTGADDGNVYCLDATTGTQLWKTPAGGITYWAGGPGVMATIRSSPTVVEGKVYVGSLDKNFYCLDADSGNVVWTFPTPGVIVSSPAVADGAVYMTSSTPRPNGTLYKLNANDGAVIWQRGIPLQRGSALFSSPTVGDGVVFVPADNFDHYCINSTTGETIWKWRATQWQVDFASLLYAEDRIYTQDLFDLVCLNATNGNLLWKTFLAREIYSSPTYAYGRVYVGTDNLAIYVLDAKTGEKLSFYDTGCQHWSSPSLYNGRVYIGGFDWNVYCFEEFIPEVPLISTEVMASLSKSQVDKDQSESVTVSGVVSPIYASVPVKVTFVKPDGTTVDVATTTDATGDFAASYTPDVVGSWTATAWWEGDEDRTYAFTEDMPLTVVGEEEPPPPSPPPPDEEEGIPTEYIYAAVAVIAIIIIAIAAYVYLKRGK